MDGRTCLSSTRTILADEHRDLIGVFAHGNVLLAFDYDGTLAPIAPTPETAEIRGETRELLAAVARLYPCIVISGRALDDLTRRLSGIPMWYVFGNHGLEPPRPGTAAPTLARDWTERLRPFLPDDPGIVIEDKRYSLTIHYRLARNRAQAIAAIDRAIAHLGDVRAIGGIESVSLLPRGGGHKGVALQQACGWFACDSAIYVGDDDTDEDAFASAKHERLLAIRVGRSEASRARFHIPAQENIDTLLRILVDLRTRREGAVHGGDRWRA